MNEGFNFPWTFLCYLLGFVLGGTLGTLITLTACGVDLTAGGDSMNAFLIGVNAFIVILCAIPWTVND